jgi:hypothetical protein
VIPEAILPKIALLPLSHSLHSRPPIGDELPPRRSPSTPLTSYRAPCTSTSPSLSPTPTVRTPLETRRRPQANGRSLATGCPEAPPSTPNDQPPPLLPVDLALARALPVPVHALDAESGTPVLRRAHARFPRSVHKPARHQVCNTTHPSPCTLAPQHAMATT